jgi:hypothetical protein
MTRTRRTLSSNRGQIGRTQAIRRYSNMSAIISERELQFLSFRRMEDQPEKS